MKGIAYLPVALIIFFGGVSTGLAEGYKPPKGIKFSSQKMVPGAVQADQLDSNFDYRFQQKPEHYRGISSENEEEEKKASHQTYVEINRVPASLEVEGNLGIRFFGGTQQIMIGDQIIERVPLPLKKEPQPKHWKYEQ